MRKLFLLLVVLAASASLASAQIIKFGVKGGVNINSSEFVLNNGSIKNQVLESVKNYAGYHVGFMTRINLAAIYVQGDVLYVRNSYAYDIKGGQLKVKENKLSVPVVAGLNILFLRVYAGPKFDFDLSNNLKKSIGNSDAIKETFDNRWLGYQLGVGADLFNRISVDLSYNGYFKAPTQQYNIGTESYQIKQKSRQFWITLGYYFGGGNNKYKKK